MIDLTKLKPPNTETTQKIGRALAITLSVLVPIVVLWAVFGPLRALANENEGFIAAVGVFFVVPFAIWASRLLDRSRNKFLSATAINLIIYELWQNLNFVGQIEVSYENNFEWFDPDKPKGIHVPHYGPRLAVLEKFITVEHLSSLTDRRRWRVLEVYAQLSTLRDDFSRWREALLGTSVLDNREVYQAVSSTLLSTIDPLMRNMVDLWVDLLASETFATQINEIKEAADLIRSRIQRGQMLHPTYKASRLRAQSHNFAPNDVIVCWRNDWREANVEIIDLSMLAALHDTWKLAPRTTGPQTPSGPAGSQA